ncbi:MAG TPA: sigma-70 family RNA polymerase sigma factor [Candidatus Ruthenibacterium avium]|uniref:Sigma-70 family RNA polymerase sigma factor n=1 Tax=Candidatus Ruthenibacterium avium TaxID=2838751 RepID=A0A9D2M4I1_9FIRM|nr:sigma-70 family RNA polymerase sigma factor [Candidatus Ruthenibacterium avium]
MPSSGQVVYDAQQVLECYGDLVLRTAFMMLKNRADAEDAAQDVFLSFIRTKPVFASAEHQKAWFLRVTLNRCKSILRSAWHQKTQPLEEAFPEQDFTERETGVMQAVQKLTQNYRTVIYLYYIQGYDTAEIAQILGVSQNTVLSRLARARKQLKGMLEGEVSHV